MRRLPAVLLIFAAIAALAACSGGATPGWTYAPAASEAPAGSGAASGGPPASASSGASVQPSVAASASAGESAAASGGAAGLTVTATSTSAASGWDPATLESAAGAGFTITFDNQDTTVSHNFVLQNADGSPVSIQGDTSPFTGPGEREYQVPALTAGEYKYICQIHPSTMVGALTVR